MPNPRETRTHAADSAPGVGDGPAGVPPPPVDSKPAGRRIVWIGVIVVCLIILVAFFTHAPGGSRGAGGETTGGTSGTVATQNPAAPAPTPAGSTGG